MILLTNNGKSGLMIDARTLKKSVLGKRVLIDTNIIIYLTEETAPCNTLSRELFSLVESGGAQAVFSLLSVFEVMQGPIRAGKISTGMTVKKYLLNFPNSFCQDITSDVIDYVGADKRVNWEILRTVDSLIIASGLHAQADLFISNDRHFMQALSPELLLSFRG